MGTHLARVSVLVSLLVGQCHLSHQRTQIVLAQLGQEAAPNLGSVEALLLDQRVEPGERHRDVLFASPCYLLHLGFG
jgi:hypothetical protein